MGDTPNVGDKDGSIPHEHDPRSGNLMTIIEVKNKFLGKGVVRFVSCYVRAKILFGFGRVHGGARLLPGARIHEACCRIPKSRDIRQASGAGLAPVASTSLTAGARSPRLQYLTLGGKSCPLSDLPLR